MSIKKMTCRQVQAILPFYIQGKVNSDISELIEEHLEECETCKQIYIKAIEEYNKFPSAEMRAPASSIKNSLNEEQFLTKGYVDFKKNLSAYFDSELDDEAQFKIKKIAISNPLARKDLENLYKFKQLLHKSFDKTKASFKEDFSKITIKKIIANDTSNSDNIFKFSAILFILAILVTVGLYLSI